MADWKNYACTKAELSCIIGNLFATLEPPCEACGPDDLMICGTTFRGRRAVLAVTEDGFRYTGRDADIRRIREKGCPIGTTKKRACEVRQISAAETAAEAGGW